MENITEKIELRPCPFCGSECDVYNPDGLIYIDNGYGVFFMSITCGCCEAEGPPVRKTDSRPADVNMAFEKWNRRARVKCVHDWLKESLENNDL